MTWNLAQRSSNVIDFGTNRKLVYIFLLVVNSNLDPILHRFRDTTERRSPRRDDECCAADAVLQSSATPSDKRECASPGRSRRRCPGRVPRTPGRRSMSRLSVWRLEVGCGADWSCTTAKARGQAYVRVRILFSERYVRTLTYSILAYVNKNRILIHKQRLLKLQTGSLLLF